MSDFSDPAPDQSFYDEQQLDEGFGYITTRDGTTLSANVSLPGPVDGPYPTVVEYSGYDPSNPANTTFAQLFNALGFAYVGVNMRGTGCSGGAFDFFEPLQSLDGYDAIETVAAQPWAKNHQVGMVGISYPGISQLFVARTRPPSLAAITPLSVHRRHLPRRRSTRAASSTPASPSPWAAQRASRRGAVRRRAGTQHAHRRRRHRVRRQPDAAPAEPRPRSQMIEDNPFYDPAGRRPARRRATFVDKIDVPVFIAGAWQDEQTGGHFPAHARRLHRLAARLRDDDQRRRTPSR